MKVISLILLSIILIMAAGVATASVITVNESSTIQDAINKSIDGDIIVVSSGNYTENVVINKELSLIAQNNVIVKAANSSDHVFHVTADHVHISNFSILNAENESGIYLERVHDNYIFNNNLMNNWNGIFLNSSYNNTLENNTVFNNTDDGFYLYNSSNNILLNNSININYNGIYIDWTSNYNAIINNNASNNLKNGISLFSSNNTTLNFNTANSNKHYGIYFSNSSNNILTHNTANLNGRNGIYIIFSDYNKLLNNVISKNSETGIGLSNSINNTIFNNYFNNTKNVEYEGTSSVHIWNISKTSAAELVPIIQNYFYNTINVGFEGIDIWNITGIPDANTGKNIAGGHYLGGNLWEKPNGEGFSQTCVDENYDGISDLPYDVREYDSDYLPLTTSDVITVDDDGLADYTTIQAAVDVAKDGNTIIVFNGTYTEHVVVDKELTITSESGNPEDTVIDVKWGKGSAVFNVTSDNVTIIGFHIKNYLYASACIRLYYTNNSIVSNNKLICGGDCGSWGILIESSSNSIIASNNLSNNMEGIYLLDSINNTLRNNKINSNSGEGIIIENSNDNVIQNNIINSSFHGIFLSSNSNHNRFVNNSISYNSGNGILIENSDDNVINSNNISYNSGNGIFIKNSNNNEINSNNISYNSDNAIFINEYSEKNRIFLNDFIIDLTNKFDDSGNNIWHTHKQISYIFNGTVYSRFLGNFYSDYNGSDNNSDGIGDTLYFYDEQPLMNFSSTYEEIEAPITINFYDENNNAVANASNNTLFLITSNKPYIAGVTNTDEVSNISNISIEVYNSSTKLFSQNILVQNSSLGTMRFGPFSITEDEMLNDSDSYMIVEAHNVTKNNSKYSKVSFKLPVYITPFEDNEFSDKNVTYHNITLYNWEKNGSLAVIASSAFEQRFAVDFYGTNELMANSLLNDKLSDLAFIQIMGLTEIAKKWPDAKIIILDENINQLERTIDKNRKDNKKVLIVGILPHKKVTFQNVEVSKAYQASYLSYMMATQINNQKLWNAENKSYVAKHFRANQYFNALNETGKYKKEEFGEITTKYPAILIALKGNPLLQVSPTLGKDIREDINSVDINDKTVYKLGTLTPLGHTYYLGLDVTAYEVINLHGGSDGASLSVNIPFPPLYISGDLNWDEDTFSKRITLGIGYPRPIWKFPFIEIRYWEKSLLEEKGERNENVIYNNIQDNKKRMNKNLGSFGNTNIFGITINEIVNAFYDFGVYFAVPHGIISEHEFLQYQMEPSNVHTVLSDTLRRMANEDKKVSEIVIYQNENYPEDIKGYNLANVGLTASADLAAVPIIPGIELNPTYSAKAYFYNYVGASEDINTILAMDDLMLIELINQPEYNEIDNTNILKAYEDTIKIVNQKDELAEEWHKIMIDKTIEIEENKLKEEENKLDEQEEELKKDEEKAETDEQKKKINERKEEISKKKEEISKNKNKIKDRKAKRSNSKKKNNLRDGLNVLSNIVDYSDQYIQAQEAAIFNSKQLFYLGDPYLTGYDDPIDNLTVSSLPEKMTINLTSSFDNVSFLNTTFIYPNVTSFNTSYNNSEINSKLVIEEWAAFTGAPQTPMYTLSILHPSNQTIVKVNYSLSDRLFKENISLPMAVVNVHDESVPGIFENFSEYPPNRIMLLTEEFTNITHTVLRIFPTTYFSNKTLVYYQNMSITLFVNNTIPKPVDVHLDAYPNILGIPEGEKANISLIVYNDIDSIQNATVNISFSSSSKLTFSGTNTTVELGTSVKDYYKKLVYNITAPNVDNKERYMLNVTLNYYDGREYDFKDYSIPVDVIPENLTELEITNANIPEEMITYQTYNISATVKNSGQETILFDPVKLFIDYDKLDEVTIYSIKPGETSTLQFDFTPKFIGTYNITVSVSAAPYETILENNYYTKMVQISEDTKILEEMMQKAEEGFNRAAGSVGEKPENIILSEVSRQYVYMNQPAYFGFIEEGNPLSYIQFTGLQNSAIIPIRVEIINENCTLVNSPPPGKLYYYTGITVGNAGWASNKTIKDPRIGFKVAKDWIVTENIDISTIAMYRYEGNAWAKLYTEQIDEDEDYLYFDSATPGFSLFSISAQRIEESVQTTESEILAEADGSGIAESPLSTTESKSRGIENFSIALILLSLIILAYYIYNRRRN